MVDNRFTEQVDTLLESLTPSLKSSGAAIHVIDMVKIQAEPIPVGLNMRSPKGIQRLPYPVPAIAVSRLAIFHGVRESHLRAVAVFVIPL